jgi:hypothetical protein
VVCRLVSFILENGEEKKGKTTRFSPPVLLYRKKRETIALDDLIREIHQISVLQKIGRTKARGGCVPLVLSGADFTICQMIPSLGTVDLHVDAFFYTTLMLCRDRRAFGAMVTSRLAVHFDESSLPSRFLVLFVHRDTSLPRVKSI